jgi:uncharacterized membrane protein YdjX (TVP38/TMEM64 family)
MFSWAALVYVLALVTSSVCALLLARSYMRNRTRLLLWSAACFVFLALNNLIVVIDLLLLPEVDLSALRIAASLVGVSLLLCGFIWEVD